MFVKNAIKDSKDEDLIEKAEKANSFEQCLRLIKAKYVLFVFDNCDSLLKKDHLHFITVIEDILDRAYQSRMIITSKNHVVQIKDITMKSIKIAELTKSASYELLLAKSQRKMDQEELGEMMDELLSRNLPTNSVVSILEHPLFELVNGHPLALIMIQSLRKEMRLKQIYELLVLIKQEAGLKESSVSEDVAIRLSMEANLLFLRNIDYNSYESLIYFSLMTSGMSNEGCSILFGNQWEEYKNLLLSKSLIKQRYHVTKDPQKTVYRIEENLRKMVIKRTCQEELDL